MNLSYFIYRLKYRYGRFLPLSVPVDVSLELASYCTNTCGYCYHADRKNLPFQKGFMSFFLARKILDEAAELGVHSLKFNYRGESTMNPAFLAITKWAKGLARGSTFIDRVTNSNFNFRHDRDDIFQGLANQTKVKVSFDSFIPYVFEQQRRGSNYAGTIANIDKFYNLKGRKTQLVIQSVRTQANKDEDLHAEIKRRWPEATASVRDVVGGRVDKDLSAVIVKDRDATERQSCLQAHVRLMVHWDGKVGACCPDISGKLVLGDASKQTLYSIFNSEEAKFLRASLKTKKAFDRDPCKNCSSFETFKGFKPNWDS